MEININESNYNNYFDEKTDYLKADVKASLVSECNEYIYVNNTTYTECVLLRCDGSDLQSEIPYLVTVCPHCGNEEVIDNLQEDKMKENDWLFKCDKCNDNYIVIEESSCEDTLIDHTERGMCKYFGVNYDDSTVQKKHSAIDYYRR